MTAIDEVLLRESAEDMFEDAPFGYLFSRPDGSIIKVNRTFLRWIGYARPELNDHVRFMDLLTPGGKLFYESHFAPSLRMSGYISEIALDLLSKDGHLIPALVSAVQKRDSEGQPQFNRITVFNATERRKYEQELLLSRKQAEKASAELAYLNAELERSNEALRASEQHLRSILDTLFAFVGVLNSDGVLLEANRAALEAASLMPEQVIGKPFADLYWWSYSPEVQSQLLDAIGKAQTGIASRYDVVIRLAEQKFISVDFSLVPMMSAEGRVTHLVPFAIDITDRKLMEADLKHANNSLLKANEELGQFAYAASHDLQEPLRNITLYSQLLARKFEQIVDPEAQSFLQFVVDGSQRMRELISDILAFSQAQHSNLILRPANLGDVLNVALANLHAAIRESGATVTHDPLPLLTVDAGRIAGLLQNLISNSIKYRKPDEPPRIHVSAESKGDQWMFAVNDNGAGFEQQYADQIFGIFKRLHGRDLPGTGIGLAICKKVVETHGGRIWAESAVGVGSTFFFTLPARSRPVQNQYQ
jgi:PAS domain S-box-containing protein